MAENEGQGGPMETPKATHGGDSLSGYTPPVEGQDDGWVPEEAIEALTMERQLKPAETNEELAERIFDENLPVAAQAICWLARNAGNSQVRMAAAKYVTERKLGRVQDKSGTTSGKDPLLQFVESVTRDEREDAHATVAQTFRQADAAFEAPIEEAGD